MRGGSHHARVWPLPGIPVFSLLTGCWAPPSSFPAPRRREALPARHFRRAGRGSKALWLEVLGRGPGGGGWTEGRRPESLQETWGARCGFLLRKKGVGERRARAARSQRSAGVRRPDRELLRWAGPGCGMLADGSKFLLRSCWCPNRREETVLGTMLPPSSLITTAALLCSQASGRTDGLGAACSCPTPRKRTIRIAQDEEGAYSG